MRLRNLFLITLLTVLSACTAFQGVVGTNAAVVKTAIELAAAKYIEAGAPTHVAQLAKAQKVKTVVAQLKSLNLGKSTLADLEATLAAQVKTLSVSDQILANGLIQALGAQINISATTGIFQAGAVAQINTVLGYVTEVTAKYGA